MKKTHNQISTSLLLSAIMVSNAYGAQNISEIPSKTIAQSINANHAQYLNSSNKRTISPPRQISPAQFQELLESNQSIDQHYQVEKKLNTKKTFNKHVSALNNALVTSCTSPAELQGLVGSDLVNAVKSGVLNSCLYGLFDSSLVGSSVFSDQSITTIVNAINTHLDNYDGTEATGAAELEKLVIYLRAMHWAESGNNRVFPISYTSVLEQTFSKYFAGEHFVTFTGDSSRNFMIRYEMLVLLSSSQTNRIPHIARMTDAILGYANTASRTDDWGVYYEENGFTQLVTHLFNASEQQSTELEQLALATPSIINNLKQFVDVDATWLIGHTREYQWADTVNELARFLRFGGAIANAVRPSIQAILNDYSHEGAGGQGWIKAQSAVSFYDSENCNLYGDACSFNLEDTVLSGNHICSTTLKVRFQTPISNENLAQICQNLSQQEQKFHQLFNTNSNTPVADDQNADLEVVIFSSYSDYDNYAGNFFGINTNNGGMYLEGEPGVQGNQARFIAHQATWLPDFTVWNLEHEYVHYLDGRFNKWGSFSNQPANSVWWGEGLAEYLSQPNNNPKALAVAPLGTYSLSELYQTTYENSNTERTYHWGYLATRFMIEEQTSEIENVLLPSMRAPKFVVASGECQFDWGWKLKSEAIENGWYWAYDDSEWSSGSWVWTCGQPQPDTTELPEFTPYQDILSTWGTSFDQDFSDWLACIVAGDGVCQATNTNPADLDGNNTVDKRDIDLFKQLLRNKDPLSLEYDFNTDGIVDRRDIRAMMALCDLARCAIAP